ncbi:hypothetical protein [uncultured Desulfuromonas sp.]|uniref:hypothetical protein n=1 Tax=uncultured Desulfuromonas sp. TaxID=181013 RepID=UPI002AAB6F3F|nr:hypothetical protein [uncultured Desulfuromonas sp.]
MTDIATISTLLSSVKTATDIAKFVKDTDHSFESAEIKLKMAELVSALADVKIELADVQDELRARDERIAQLERDLSKKQQTHFDGKIYWIEGDETPFCTVCLEKDSKYHHLTYIEADSWGSRKWYCNVCENQYYI